MLCFVQHFATDAWIFNGAFGWDWKVIHPSAVNPQLMMISQPQKVCMRVERHWQEVWTRVHDSAGTLRSHRFATAQQYSFRNVQTSGNSTFYFSVIGVLMLSFVRCVFLAQWCHSAWCFTSQHSHTTSKALALTHWPQIQSDKFIEGKTHGHVGDRLGSFLQYDVMLHCCNLKHSQRVKGMNSARWICTCT